MSVSIPQSGSALRILSHHSPFLMRIGWLRLIARLLRQEPIPKARLGDILFETAEPAYQKWLEQSGLGHQLTPFSEAFANSFPREANRFGLYSTKEEDLTELGQALALADHLFSQEDSPFVWPAPLRFMGLWILLQADGDLILPWLRAWPENNRLDEALPMLRAVVSKLLTHVRDEDQFKILDDFLNKANLASESKAYEFCVYPLAEPLRELGYVDRKKYPESKRKIYVLTERGQRLVHYLRSEGPVAMDASKLLESRLGELFLYAEGISDPEPVSLEDLRQTLILLPPQMLGGMYSETPLAPAVYLSQARLIQQETGRRIELDQVRLRLRRLGQLSKGKIGLKEGRMAGEANVMWTSDEELKNAALWVIPAESRANYTQAPTTAPPEQPPPTPPEEPPPAPPQEPPPTPPQEPPPAPPEESLTPAQSRRIERWLQYLARLLEAPSLGSPDIFIVGGPVSWVDRLVKIASMESKYLQGKRMPQEMAPQESGSKQVPPCVYLLSQFKAHAGDVEACKILYALAERWGNNSIKIHLLRANVERTSEALRELRPAGDVGYRLEEKLFAGTEEKRDWNDIRWLTLALLGDILEQHQRSKRDIVARLGELEQPVPSRNQIRELLRYLGEPGNRTDFAVVFPANVPEEWVDFVRGQPDSKFSSENTPVEITLSVEPEDRTNEAPPDSRHLLNVTVALSAQSPDLAKLRARELALDMFARLRALVSTDPARDFEGIVFPNGPIRVVQMPDYAECSAGESTREVPFGSSAYFRRDSASGWDWTKLRGLPWLDQASIHDGPSARTKLMRTFHWLTLAEHRGLSPAQKLGHLWIALEHLVVEKGEENGASVAETLADVGALCRLETLCSVLVSELCAALRLVRPLDNAWESRIRNHLGANIWKLIMREHCEPQSIQNDNALRFLLSTGAGEWENLATAIENDSPYVASLIRFFACTILNESELKTWLQATRREIQSLVFHAYEVRNLLFHDGAIFHFKDGTMLEHLYVRLRLITDAIVRRFAIMALDENHEPSTNAIWAHLRLGIHDLLHETKQKRPNTTIDPAQLLRAVLQPQLPHPSSSSPLPSPDSPPPPVS